MTSNMVYINQPNISEYIFLRILNFKIISKMPRKRQGSRGVKFLNPSVALDSIEKSYAGTKTLILLRVRWVNSSFLVLFFLHRLQYLTNQVPSTTIKGGFVRRINRINWIFDYGLKNCQICNHFSVLF